jgi:hypothetical protein
MPVDAAEFDRILPSGFLDCGECSTDWGILFKNPRPRVGRRLLVRREQPAEPPPLAFTPDEIPWDYYWTVKALSGVIAKANKWYRGNAVGELLFGLVYAGVSVLRDLEWGRASWLPPIAPPKPDDAFMEAFAEKGMDEPLRSIWNVNRALLALHGLFAGFSVLALVGQTRVGDTQTRVGDMYIGRMFDGDADQFAGVILPHFYASGQRFYWAFRDNPDAAPEALWNNVALVFQHPLVQYAVTSLEDAWQRGLELELGESIEGWMMLPSLFVDGFVRVNDLIVERGAARRRD